MRQLLQNIAENLPKNLYCYQSNDKNTTEYSIRRKVLQN